MRPIAPGLVSVPLARPRGARSSAALLVLMVLGFWAILVALVLGAGPVAAVTGGSAPAVVVVTALLAVLTVVAWRYARLAFGRPPRLVVDGDRMWLDAPALLAESPRWHRNRVHQVAIDEGPGVRGGDQGRFRVLSAPRYAAPLTESELELGYLFTRLEGGAFPVVALRSGVPNLAIALTETHPGPRLRMMTRLIARRWGSPRLDRPAEGILLEVEDCAQARAALAPWQEDGPLVAPGEAVPAGRTARGETPMHGAPEPPSRPLALALVAGAYLIPLLLAAALLAAPLLEWRAGHLSILGIVVGLLGVAILIAVIPRPAPEPTGPDLTPARQPVLFRLIDEAAGALGVEPFDRVVADLGPTVRTCVVGVVRRRRFLVIGLPLAAMLTRQELLALVARELAHARGPRRRVNAATLTALDGLERTVEGLRGDWFTAVPARVLAWYAGIVERRVPALRRERELAADLAAAEVAGIEGTAGMLRAATCVEEAYLPYWERHVGPVLAAGRRPPIVDGLRRFLSRPWIRHHLAQTLADESGRGTAASWSHPSLGDRLSALGTPPPPGPGARTAGVLDDDELERALVAELADPARATALARISWSQVGEDVVLPRIRGSAARVTAMLSGVRVEALAAPWDVARRVGLEPSSGVDDTAVDVLGAALCVALADAGWSTAAEPGDALTVSHGEEAIRPFAEVAELLDGRPDASERWCERCAALGIGSLPLGGRPARRSGSHSGSTP